MYACSVLCEVRKPHSHGRNHSHGRKGSDYQEEGWDDFGISNGVQFPSKSKIQPGTFVDIPHTDYMPLKFGL